MDEIIHDKTGAGANKRRLKLIKKHIEEQREEEHNLEQKLRQIEEQMIALDDRKTEMIGDFKVKNIHFLTAQSDQASEHKRKEDILNKIEQLKRRREEKKYQKEMKVASEKSSKIDSSMTSDDESHGDDKTSVYIEKRRRVEFRDIKNTFEFLNIKFRSEKMPFERISELVDQASLSEREITIAQLIQVLRKYILSNSNIQGAI